MHQTQADNQWTIEQEPNPSAGRERLHCWLPHVSSPMRAFLGVIFIYFWAEFDSRGLEYAFRFQL